MKKLAFLLPLIIVIALSGCVGNDVTSFAKSLPEIQTFLAQNPDASINAALLDKETVQSTIQNIRQDCGQQMQVVPYWHVQLTKGNEKAEVYLDESGKQALCIVKHGASTDNTTPPNANTQDSCSTNIDCNDNNPCTTDTCTGTPKTCTHATINTCISGDGCCPVNCPNDNDCQITDPCSSVNCASNQKCVSGQCVVKTCTELGGKVCSTGTTCSGSTATASDSSSCCIGTCHSGDQCQANSECYDGNYSTIDICTGSPKACSHSLNTCSGQGGRICTSPQICPTNYVPASDSSACCMVSCSSGCSSTYKLVNGQCVPKTCSERGGSVCTSQQVCSGTTTPAGDTTSCCIGTCTAADSCGNSCPIDYKCSSGQCVLKTCAEQGRYTCSATQTCTSNFFWKNASDTSRCCAFQCIDKLDYSVSGPVNIGSPSHLNEDLCSANYLLLTITVTNPGTTCQFVVYAELLDGVQVMKTAEQICDSGRYYFWALPQVLNKKLTFILDPDNEIEETDETNNRIDYQFNFAAKDISVKSINYTNGYIKIYLNVDISNPDCPSVPVTVYIDGTKYSGHESGSGAEVINGVSSYSFYFRYSLSSGTHTIKAVIDPDNTIQETDKTNNEMTKDITV